MVYYDIPEGSVETQPGLWAYLHTFIVKGVTYNTYHIYSSEGYCFYEVDQPENYDEEGNLRPEDELMYATLCYTAYETLEEINAHFISVPYKEGYEIV